MLNTIITDKSDTGRVIISGVLSQEDKDRLLQRMKLIPGYPGDGFITIEDTDAKPLEGLTIQELFEMIMSDDILNFKWPIGPAN